MHNVHVCWLQLGAAISLRSVFERTCTSDCLYLLYVHMQDYSEYIKPHSLKAESSGRPVVVYPLLLYTDDTSGNRSKKWNKFNCWCMTGWATP